LEFFIFDDRIRSQISNSTDGPYDPIKIPQTSAGTAVPQFADSDRKPIKLTEVVHPDGRISQYPPSEVWDDWVEWDGKEWPAK
jgi:hypothetical protein